MKDKNQKTSGGMIAALTAAVTVLILLLTGCSVKDVIGPMQSYFEKKAQAEEETAAVAYENTLLYAPVNDAEGRAMMKADGQPLTVPVAYETATGGEYKYDTKGEIATHPDGEVMTYAPGSAVTNEDGTPETYAGGETITDLLGIPVSDADGQVATRAAGEIVTHGADDLIYDEEGNRTYYHGEPMTYGSGDYLLDTNGEKETYPVAIQRNMAGEEVTNESGEILLGAVEIMKDVYGNPLLEEDGEIATKQLEPIPPEHSIDQPMEEGEYYIRNIASPYVFFAAPEVQAENVAVVAEEGEDAAKYAAESGTGTIRNLQLEILGEDLPYFDLRFDGEGYVHFVLQDTDQVLTLAGDLRNGVNVLLQEMNRTPYPQYKYWDDPPYYTIADNQRWLLKKLDDGTYAICSALDPDYVLTVDDQFGIQYANIMLWKFDDREQQKFAISRDTPKIEEYLEEGTYYIRSGLSNWMLATIEEGNYSDGSSLYLYSSYAGEGQAFQVTYDEYGFATFAHGESDEVLTVGYAEARNGQTICQYPSDGTNWQKWIIDPVDEEGAEGLYYIRSALNISEVVDLTDGFARNGKPLQTYWNNQTYAQYWGFETSAIPSPYAYGMTDYAQNFSSRTDYLVLVSSGTNHVGVFYGSRGNWTCIQFWDCVTGKLDSPTVTGEFSIYAKSEYFNGNMDVPEGYTCRYASLWYPDYFFHSIIYRLDSWDIMDASMGYNGSHGCVRLYTENAQWIYNNVPIGTKVVSY